MVMKLSGYQVGGEKAFISIRVIRVIRGQKKSLGSKSREFQD